MGGAVGKVGSPKKAWIPETKLEAKVVEAMRRRETRGSSIKSFNSIILKFPKIDESLRKCKATFEQFDEDSNGVIDQEELRKCFHKLETKFTDDEINDLFEACDINEDMGMKFNEFIVLLCLVYLLKDDPAASQAEYAGQHVLEPYRTRQVKYVTFPAIPICLVPQFRSLIMPQLKSVLQYKRNCFSCDKGFNKKSRMGMPDLEATFETLVGAFVFLDKNKDGYVSKNEMVQAINESGERSSGRIAMKRFEEMDWDKNGMVNFKEFLFAFTNWVGIDDDNEDKGGEED